MGRLLCWLGIHGPNVFGNESTHRSYRSKGFARECAICGAVWHGRQVETRYTRTLGDWRRVK